LTLAIRKGSKVILKEISKENYPPEETTFIGYNEDGDWHKFCILDHYGFVIERDWPRQLVRITHWCSLPEPPASEPTSSEAK